MPPEKTPMPPRSRKRQLEAEPTTDSSPPLTTKRQKLENHQPYRTPPSWFWDNLSRLWLTPRALREFDRRTVWSTAPVPPHRTGKEDIDLAQLKRFARHGGPSLGDLRAVSSIQPFLKLSSDCMSVSRRLRNRHVVKSIGLPETSQD